MHSREFLRRLPEQGGRTRLTEDGDIAGPPKLNVELAPSSALVDVRDKRRACCRSRVHEYLVSLLAEAPLEWLCLEDDKYRPKMPDPEGRLSSRLFPGLRLPVATLLACDTAKVLEVLTDQEPASKPPEASVTSGDTFMTPLPTTSRCTVLKHELAFVIAPQTRVGWALCRWFPTA